MKKLIGRGAFSKVYRSGDDDFVTIVTTDKAKECLSLEWHDDPAGLFPICEQIDSNFDAGTYTYKMEYYPKVSSLKNTLDPDQWALYKTLRGIDLGYTPNKYDLYSKVCTAFEALEIEEDQKESLISMLDSLSNFGSDIGFEISPRNVAVKDGKLILLDCFFFVSDLKRVRS